MTRGFLTEGESKIGDGTLAPWEVIAIDAVGLVIDFWRFKRTHGCVWALLYLRDQPMSALAIQNALGLSKGGVSMALRELEQWGVVLRVRDSGDATWRFAAESDLMKMVGRVIAEREGALVRRVRIDLERAQKLATDGRAAPKTRERIERMTRLAKLTERALDSFVATARFDFGRAADVLKQLRITR